MSESVISTDSMPIQSPLPTPIGRGPTSAWLVAGRAVLGNPTRNQLHAVQRLVRDWANDLDADLACIPSSGPGPLPGAAPAPCNIAIGIRASLARRGSGPSAGLAACEVRDRLRRARDLPDDLWADVAAYAASWARCIPITAQPTSMLLAGCGHRAESRVIYGYPRKGDDPRGIVVAEVAWNTINLQSLDMTPEAHAERRVDVGDDAYYFVIAR